MLEVKRGDDQSDADTGVWYRCDLRVCGTSVTYREHIRENYSLMLEEKGEMIKVMQTQAGNTGETQLFAHSP